MAESLQAIFLSKEWKGNFNTLSDTTGFNLSIYIENGNRIFSTGDYHPVCKSMLSSGDIKAKCDTYCRSTIMSVFDKKAPIIYKCYSRIINFALPVAYLGEKAVVLGQGSFTEHKDFLEFTKRLSFLDIQDLSVKHPIKFTSTDHARNACRLTYNFINQFLKSTQETVTLKQKMESMREILSMWGIAAKAQPDAIYKYMTVNLCALLDINCNDSAVFMYNAQHETYTSLDFSKKNNGISGQFSIMKDDIIVQGLLGGKPFVTSSECHITDRADFLKGQKVFYFFPIMANQRLEGIVWIVNKYLNESDINTVGAFCKHTAIALENQKIRAELYGKLDKYTAISKMTNALTPIRNYESLLQTILDKSTELLNAEKGSLMLIDYETDLLLLRAKKGMNNGKTENLKMQRGEGIAGKVVELGEPFLVQDVENDPRIGQKNKMKYKTRSFVSIPIKVEDCVIGVLNLSDKATGKVFDEEDLKLLQLFASQAAMVLERNVLYKQTEELKKLSITDPLTGLLNRRYLNDRLEEEVSRSKRYGRTLSILMVDVDKFKIYNDRFGHFMGDKVLKAIADSMLNSVRAIDILSRYGGDEFVIILPETEQVLALDIAERLRQDTAKTDLLSLGITGADALNLTISIGVVSYPIDGDTRDLLLEKVDTVVYLAKNRGGNRIEVGA